MKLLTKTLAVIFVIAAMLYLLGSTAVASMVTGSPWWHGVILGAFNLYVLYIVLDYLFPKP